MSNEDDVSNEDCVNALIAKAANGNDYDAAMKFAQAALNAANAMCALKAARENVPRETFPPKRAAIRGSAFIDPQK